MKVIEWLGDRLRLLDQSELPDKIIYLELTDFQAVIHAIKTLKVRGAPAIGITAAYGIALGALNINKRSYTEFIQALNLILEEFALSRPTAVNLFSAIDTMLTSIAGQTSISAIKNILIQAALTIHSREEQAMAALSKSGAALLKDGCNILTHCNTGQLATGVNYGTALGVIKAAVEQGKSIHVYADETRPVLQGARLTTWELIQEKISVTLITDNMAGYFINKGKIDCVLVGADRIAANGDTANKIGTYGVAVLARENHIPFYVAAPISSFDIKIHTGKEIVIEEREPGEITTIKGVNIAPRNVHVLNPAFDVTPAGYITAFITEKGIIGKPYKSNLKSVLQEDSRCLRRR